jgi:hypothetical protein
LGSRLAGRLLSFTGSALAVSLQVSPDLLGDEPDPCSHPDGWQFSSFNEEIHLPARDGEEPRCIGHRHECCPLRRRTYGLRMDAHSFTLPEPPSVSTSAELHRLDSPQEELDICKAVVLAEALAGSLSDVPLLTPDELALRSRLLAGGADWREARALVNAGETRQETRRWFIQRGSAWSRQDVVAAARRVECAVQARLWLLGGPGAVIEDGRFRSALWGAQHQAHEAVAARGSRKLAKEVQREAAGDRFPLTVCRGRQLRRLPEDVLRANAPDLLAHYGDNIVPLGHGDGCGVIMLDSSEPRPPKKYCEDCSKKAGNTMNAGLAKNALARLKASRNKHS